MPAWLSEGQHGTTLYLSTLSCTHFRTQFCSISPTSHAHFPGRSAARRPPNRGCHSASGPTTEEGSEQTRRRCFRSTSFPSVLSLPLKRTFLQAEELAYVYQRVGFQCLLETRFEDAGFCLFQGELDPRILISYFPDLHGTLLDAHPTLDVFAGIAECMPPYDSIDDLSMSPPLFPPPRSAHPHTRNDVPPSALG